MNKLKLRMNIRTLLIVFMGAMALMLSAVTKAHTTQICWKDVGSVTTFYAGTYHSGFPVQGSIIIDSFEYPFSNIIPVGSLPSDAHCYSSSYGGGVPGDPDGVPGPGVRVYSTFTGSFPGGFHTIGFTTTSIYEWPIEPFPAQTFGGGACADADFDGICNDVDSCPLDAANDGDGDGICGNVDNCPLDYNVGQTDINGNGQGDVCEGVVCGNGLLQGAEQCDDGNIAGGDGCSAICTIELADSPPVADAGIDQAVYEAQLVALNGSGSNDPDNDPLTYLWSQLTGTTVSLSDATSDQPTFVAPVVAIGGDTIDFKLTVTANGVSRSDTVSITIANINHVPVAEAGSDQSVLEGSSVILDGSASFDIDSDALTYQWTQVAGTLVTLTGDTTTMLSFTAPVIAVGGAPGIVDTLIFNLTVDDGFSPDAPVPGYAITDNVDTVTIEVTNVNHDPVADAGTDKTLNENGAVQLNGNGSSDPDGDLLMYSWIQTGGTPVALAGNTTATPSFTSPFVSPGGESLIFELTVDDGYFGVSQDLVVINVQNINDPPLVSAAMPTVECLWPPNHNLVSVGITGVSDPQDNATITINSVTQDEVTNGLGDGDAAIDAIINGDGTVLLRAERSGKGDGRVYHVHFTASDIEGSASGVVNVCVQHNKKREAIDGGELYDSTQ